MFLGNSFTYTWDVPDQVQALAASADPSQAMEVDEFTVPAATLAGLIERHAPDRIRDGGYDVVVLQGDTHQQDLHRFIEAATSLDEVVRESGARSVMYMAWPSSQDDLVDMDDIVSAHRQLESDLGVPVAPVGLALERALAERPDLPMLGPDGVHQVLEGTYLAAATMYATMFERSPEGLPYCPQKWPGPVSEEDCAFLQRIAWETVHAWNMGYPDAE